MNFAIPTLIVLYLLARLAGDERRERTKRLIRAAYAKGVHAGREQTLFAASLSLLKAATGNLDD